MGLLIHELASSKKNQGENTKTKLFSNSRRAQNNSMNFKELIMEDSSVSRADDSMEVEKHEDVKDGESEDDSIQVIPNNICETSEVKTISWLVQNSK